MYKRLNRLVMASITVLAIGAGLSEAVPAMAVQGQASTIELLKGRSGYELVEKNATGTIIGSSSLATGHGNRQIQAHGQPAVANFAGLYGEGVPLAIVVSAGTTDVTWSNDVPNSDIHVFVDGSEVALENSANSGTTHLAAHPGQQMSIAAVRTHPADDANAAYATADFTQETVFVPQTTSQIAVASALLATTQAATSKFRQTTFIPDAYLDAPQGVCTPLNTNSYRFVGDARTWSSADSASYRTRMDVLIDWLSGPSISWSRSVGTTVRQVQNAFGSWVFDTSATAPNTSMTMVVQSTSSNSAVIHLHQDVTNPLCNGLLTNGIYADTNLAIYRTGAISGSINYLAMPNYELYLRQDSGSYSTVARLAYISPLCLVKSLGGVACTTATSF
ncbi:MAG: hypothetical protein RL036_565 [Actinomycetota bacterium]